MEQSDEARVHRPSDLTPAYVARFWGYVEKGDACWLWTGPFNGRYGTPGTMTAHLASVLIDGREVPYGYHVHHACFTPRCVRPDHLQVMSREEHYAADHRASPARQAAHKAQIGRPLRPEHKRLRHRVQVMLDDHMYEYFDQLIDHMNKHYPMSPGDVLRVAIMRLAEQEGI